jgi:Uma2 family endonuclease
MIAAGILTGTSDVGLDGGVVVHTGRNGHPIPYLFSVEEYDQLLSHGIFKSGDPVELIRGEVIAKMPHGDPHGVAVETLNLKLIRLLSDEFTVRCQLPIVFSDSEPEPDLVICLPTNRRGNRHPRPEQVFLVAEIADSSLRVDCGKRLVLYAEAGIPVYWIVNVGDRRIEVYTEPHRLPGEEPAYQVRTDYLSGQQVPVLVAGAVIGQIPVDAILT